MCDGITNNTSATFSLLQKMIDFSSAVLKHSSCSIIRINNKSGTRKMKTEIHDKIKILFRDVAQVDALIHFFAIRFRFSFSQKRKRKKMEYSSRYSKSSRSTYPSDSDVQQLCHWKSGHRRKICLDMSNETQTTINVIFEQKKGILSYTPGPPYCILPHFCPPTFSRV